jgi:non-specific serine/threonine protein kinase
VIPDTASSQAGTATLPRPLTPLVGRQRELTEVAALLENHRLVTLSGPGGCGKTRLAVAVATELTGKFADGVWWVDLAVLTDPDGVTPAVATVLRIREQPGRLLHETFRDRLGDSDLLLILDNCEHLVGACAALVTALLAGSTRLRILTTSREPLRLNGERIWPVLPLPVPDPGNLPPPHSLPRYDAVRLLVERVSAVEPGFTVTADNAAAVALVCHKLDGIPLAIELTAARVRMLAIEEIAAGLTTSFDLATGGWRGAAPQQRTLRATMDWSHALLTTEEAVLFRRLAVFRCGFTASAATAVCAGAEIDPEWVFDLLTRLVDKSLVLVDKRDGKTRYRLLQMVGQYAREKLTEPGEAVELHTRHARYFLGFAEDIEPRINTAGRELWLARLESEVDNLRAALSWSRTEGPPDLHVRLASVLMWFWLYRGHLTEGRSWLASAIDLGRGHPDRHTAGALNGAGLLAWSQGDHPAAHAHLAESIALWRELGQPVGLAEALRFLSATAEAEGDYPRARSLIEESVRLLRTETSTFDLAMALARLGGTAALQEDFDTAWPALEESAAISRRTGDEWVLALALRQIGLAGLRRGDHAKATGALTECLALLRGQQEGFLSSTAMETLAAVLAAQEEHPRAARLFGAAEALRERMGVTILFPVDHERGVAHAKAALGEGAFRAAWSSGRALSLAGAIDLALQPATPATTPPELTAREADVLRLVARGLTNEQVAKELFISPRTVNWHLTSVYAKLGLRSRTEATRFALERGLH